MIHSPLEQFNILSIYDFSLLNVSNFEYIYAKLLLWLWYTLSSTISVIEPVSTVFASLLPFVKTVVLWLAQSLTELNLIQITVIIDWVYSLYYNILSFVWYVLHNDLSVIYSTDHLFFTKGFDIVSNALQQPNVQSVSANVPSNYQSMFVNANISLINGGLGVTLTTIYFIFLEVWYGVSTFIYQLTIEPLFYLTTKDFSYLILSLNTSTIWLAAGAAVFTFLLTASLKTVTLIPKNNWQTLLESLYGTILNVVYENAGPKNVKYFPLIFTTFLIILMCNLLGMIPYSFTVTSHLIVTFSAALAIFIGMNIIGILKHGKHFLSLFFPPGAPLALALLLVIIEFVSYVFRVFSLSIRLFANLMSGHTLLKILSGFAWVTVSFWGIFLIPIVIIFLITGLELMIACLQAYIFVVLLCIYIHDAINLH